MPKTDQLSRRALLGASAAAAAVVAAPVALAGAKGAVKGDHPDAALFAAWDAYRKELAILYAMPETSKQAEAAREAQWEVVTAHADTILAARAVTMDGLNVQLRLLFACLMECTDSERAAVFGAPISKQLQTDLGEDYRHRMLWRMVESTTPGRRPLAEG